MFDVSQHQGADFLSDSQLPRAEMRDYVVILREEVLAPDGLPQGKRRVREIARLNGDFQQKLSERLRKKGLERQVEGFAPPLAFAPMLTLSCTLKVSEFLRTMREVKDVVLDSHDMGLIR